jgi:hypothetical protein
MMFIARMVLDVVRLLNHESDRTGVLYQFDREYIVDREGMPVRASGSAFARI